MNVKIKLLGLLWVVADEVKVIVDAVFDAVDKAFNKASVDSCVEKLKAAEAKIKDLEAK